MLRTMVVLVLLIACVVDSPAWAQGPRWGRGGGWCSETGYGRAYNPATVQTLEGTVRAVEYMHPARGMSRGIHVQVAAAKETLWVHLGPAWYLENQDVPIAKGDRLTVKGSRISLDGKDVIIAAEITKGDRTLTLRDAAGIPSWAGWRRGGFGPRTQR